MKTIAVTAPLGWAIKEYLLSDFLQILASQARVIVLSPLADDPNFRNHFKSENVIIEKIWLPELGPVSREIERLLVYAHYYRHPSVMGANDIFFQSSKHKRERLPWRSVLKFAVIRPITNFAAKTLFKHITIEQQIYIEQFFYSQLKEEAQRLAGVLQKHQVDLVFSTCSILAYLDRPTLWAARQLGIPATCIIPSWDSLYGKGRMPVRFSHYLVWSEWMADILRAQYPEVSHDQVSIVGPLFLDFYSKKHLRLDRREFIQSLGGNPDRPLILWACAPKSQTPNQPRMIEEFCQAIRNGRVVGNPQLLVRPHPVGGGAHFAEFRAKYPEVLFTETNADDPRAGTRWNPSLEDIKILVNSIVHSSLMINFSSSITLEGFLADKPVVNIAYDFTPSSDYEQFTRRAYQTESYRPVMELGATKIAYSFDELVNHVNSYLKDPAQDWKKRAALLQLICSEVDGRAAERAAQCLLRLVGVGASEATVSVIA